MTIEVSLELISGLIGFGMFVIGVYVFVASLLQRLKLIQQIVESGLETDFGSAEVLKVQKEVRKDVKRMLAIQIWQGEKITGQKPPQWATTYLNGGDPGDLVG